MSESDRNVGMRGTSVRPPRIVGAMDVGGSHVNAALIAVSGTSAKMLARQDSTLDSHVGRDELLAQLVAPALRLESASTVSWEVAFPGPFDYAQGRGSFDGVGKFQAIANVDLSQEFGQRLGVDGTDIRFVNDAEAYDRGEWPSGERAERFVCITLGTGVGSVFLDEGITVTTGDDVPLHGWVHHLTHGGRPLEDSVSTKTIRAAYRRSSGLDAEVKDIAEEARQGKPAAHDAICGPMRVLGEALAPWFMRFDASDVVIGGRFPSRGI